MRLRMSVVLACCAWCFLAPHRLLAQNEIDVAMEFFRDGGAYCFRLAPEGTNLSEETDWTVMMLTGGGNRRNEFRIRSMDPGATRLSGKALTDVGLAITSIWRRDRIRDEFFERFAVAITGGLLRARVVTLSPPGLSGMTLRERAETYLKFADKGSKVDFSKSSDLTAEKLLSYQTYAID
jgi:hypothetical protein